MIDSDLGGIDGGFERHGRTLRVRAQTVPSGVRLPSQPAVSVPAILASPISEMRPDVMAAITKSIHKRQPGVPISPYLESGGTDGKVYRIAGIPTFATSGLFIYENEMFAHGLNERIPVKSFYDGLEHIHDLAIDLGGVH